jgi:hypothetical protein
MPPAPRAPKTATTPAFIPPSELPAHQDTVSPLGFVQVDPMAPPEGSSSPGTPGRTTAPIRHAPDPGSGENPSEPDSKAASTATKTPTSGRSRTSLDSSAIRDLARTAVGGSAELAHENFARSDEAKTADLWLTTDEQDSAIGDPIANIIARRINLGKIAGPDADDIIALITATAGYVTQQLRKLSGIRRDRRARKQKLVAAPVDQVSETEGVNA